MPTYVVLVLLELCCELGAAGAFAANFLLLELLVRSTAQWYTLFELRVDVVDQLVVLMRILLKNFDASDIRVDASGGETVAGCVQ